MMTSNALAYVLMFVCLFAALLELACMRDCKIPDNRLSMMGRRMLIAGFLVNAIRLYYEATYGTAPAFSVTGLTSQGLIVTANIVRCMNRLWVIDKLKSPTTKVIEFDRTGFLRAEGK